MRDICGTQYSDLRNTFILCHNVCRMTRSMTTRNPRSVMLTQSSSWWPLWRQGCCCAQRAQRRYAGGRAATRRACMATRPTYRSFRMLPRSSVRSMHARVSRAGGLKRYVLIAYCAHYTCSSYKLLTVHATHVVVTSTWTHRGCQCYTCYFNC